MQRMETGWKLNHWKGRELDISRVVDREREQKREGKYERKRKVDGNG
jgi:hypothetical protein